MDLLPPKNDDHPSKRARLGNGPEPFDQTVEAKAGTGIPELENIKQSSNQLAYLQAQLAATEALQAAYQAELLAVSERLRDIKRAHLQSGQPLWKGTSEAAEASRRLMTAATSCDEDLETFSDIEEEVLLLSPDSTAAAHDDPHHHQQQPHAVPSAAQCSAPDSTTTTGGGLGTRGDSPAGAQEAPGEGACNAAGPCPGQAATENGVDGGRGADPDGQPDGAPATATDVSRLEALEAACSAVAQEDMEAQGAVACLAGRTGKYYLRSIVVTLGRATESKGEVDVDLTPEEGPLPAPWGGSGPPAAAAPSGGGEGAGAAGTGAAAGGGVQATAPVQMPSASEVEGGGGGGGAEGGGGAGGAAAPGGRGHRVSRRQALIRLGPDGQFRLVNMGRQPVLVNDVKVDQQQTVTLPHLSLIEVADVRLLFMANLAAVARVVRRSAALVL